MANPTAKWPLSSVLVAFTILCLLQAFTLASSDDQALQQGVLQAASPSSQRHLTGKFLHITDIHPDPFYKINTATDDESVCHRGKGAAGYLGAETTDCDSPYSLVNATFDWIKANLKDSIDFVVWTGDSARHDNDEQIGRDAKQVIDQNVYLVDGMLGALASDDDSSRIPVIPTIGNNDIVPHNILKAGPNQWTKEFARIWKRFIPEEQRAQFKRCGWFYVEVIRSELVVFSLNTMYFFEKNTAVTGCEASSDPGSEQMEWLRLELQKLRERGMKAIISGHVPPARTSDKTGWHETCWQKYALWMRQYRDVIVGSLYGHMNIDHFFLQDFQDLQELSTGLDDPPQVPAFDEQSKSDVSTLSADEYLVSLREQWSKLPNVPDELDECDIHRNSKLKKYLDSIGGPWAERFSMSLTSASVVPNFFPTLRVFEYNTSGLGDDAPVSKAIPRHNAKRQQQQRKGSKTRPTIPDPPPKSAPPGPAYSPQSLSLLGYIQYFANITTFNNGEKQAASWNVGPSAPNPEFTYEIEYDTRAEDDAFALQDGLFVHSMVRLASKIGRSTASEAMTELSSSRQNAEVYESRYMDNPVDPLKKKHKKKKHHRKKGRRIANKAWFAFVQRAYVGTMNEEELHETFGDDLK